MPLYSQRPSTSDLEPLTLDEWRQRPAWPAGALANTDDVAALAEHVRSLRLVVLQSAVRVEGDRAWATTLWVEMANNGPADEMKMGTYGIYEDQFSRLDGRWLIQRRRVLNEFIPNRHSGPDNPLRAMDAAADAARGGGG